MSPLLLLIFAGIIIALVIHWNRTRDADGLDPALVQACKGDRALAKRLIDQVKLKYPDKSDRWHVEKVIYDLERDRSGGRAHPYFLSSGEIRDKAFLAGIFLLVANTVSSALSGLFRR